MNRNVLSGVRSYFASQWKGGYGRGKAYRLAGYAFSYGNPSHLHGITQIKARIEELTADAALRAGISREMILRELKALALSNIANYAYVESLGDLVNLPEEHSKAVLECHVTTRTTRTGDVTRTVDLKLHDKKGSLETLGRHLKMWTDKSEVEHTGLIPIQITEEESRL